MQILLIAAIVMTNNGILVSNNTKHYENISRLNLINWNLKIAPIFQKKITIPHILIGSVMKAMDFPKSHIIIYPLFKIYGLFALTSNN